MQYTLSPNKFNKIMKYLRSESWKIIIMQRQSIERKNVNSEKATIFHKSYENKRWQQLNLFSLSKLIAQCLDPSIKNKNTCTLHMRILVCLQFLEQILYQTSLKLILHLLFLISNLFRKKSENKQPQK